MFCQNLLETLGIGHTVVTVEGYTEMLSALENGKADAGVFNHLQASQASRGRGVSVTPIVFNPIQIRYATPKGDPAGLLPALDAYMTLIEQDDAAEYRRLIEHWFGIGDKTSLPLWARYFAIAALAIIILAMLLNLWLRRMVRKRTRELEASNQALKESGDRHRLILNSAMDGYLLTDPAGQVMEANQTYCMMSGYSIDELLHLARE